MARTTNTLFHFTNLNSAISILRGKVFWPIYNLEIFSSEYYSDHKYAIPMVCFCDLDIKLTKYHQREFGPCSIGLKKLWAIEKRLNPISYQLPKSAFTSANEDLVQLLQAMISDNSRNDELSSNLMHSPVATEISKNQISSDLIIYLFTKFLMTIHAFKKPYSGKKFSREKKEFLDEVVTYYNESEWRFVPEMYPNHMHEYQRLSNNDHRPILDEKTYQDAELKQQYQKYINLNHPLRFEENDIDIILVKTEEEKLSIQTNIAGFYSDGFIHTAIKTYLEAD